jgi:hypothetical protein
VNTIEISPFLWHGASEFGFGSLHFTIRRWRIEIADNLGRLQCEPIMDATPSIGDRGHVGVPI